MRIDIAMQINALHTGLILIVGQHLLRRNEAGLQNMLLVVNVMQEGIERPYALANAAIEHRPFGGRNNARHAVERDQPLGAVIVAVDVEGDAHPVKQQLSLFPLALHGLVIGLLQPLPVGVVVATVFSLSQKHLIKKR